MKYLKFLIPLLLVSCIVSTPRFDKRQALKVNGASGFKLDRYLVSANHVVSSPFAAIEDKDGNEYIAAVVARDTANDIVLLQAHTAEYWQYSIAEVHVHETVCSVGNPSRLWYSEMCGEVEAVDRQDARGKDFIQIGIDVYWGSSGSAVFDAKGRIVGMIVEAIPGTRFTFLIEANKIQLLIKKTNNERR